MADREYFFEDEAKAKVGKQIRSQIEFSGVTRDQGMPGATDDVFPRAVFF